jgi:hypothetical protein
MSKRSKVNHKNQSFISIGEAAYAMRIPRVMMDTWIREGKIRPVIKHNESVIPIDVFKNIAHSPMIFEATLNAAANEAQRRQSDRESGLSDKFKKEISKLVQEYRINIDNLEKIHRRYHEKFTVLRNQSPDTAAYILHSKVISLLRMACLCFENQYWESIVLLRPIDEALHLADYFIISAKIPEGTQHLGEWFRENKSPPDSVCRKAIDKYVRSLSPSLDNDLFANAMNQIYRAKSKPVHNTLNNIMEVYQIHFDGNKLIGVGFDYGPCSYPRKVIDLLRFFRSSIWSTVQSFLFCFRLGSTQIDSNDIEALESLNQRFLNE